MEAEQLWKCVKGNDIWAFAVVECVTSFGEQLIPDDVQEVIEEYADIFQDPKQLPPSRVYDHAISLQAGQHQLIADHTDIPLNTKLKLRNKSENYCKLA
jgi:hypothetical protein